MGRISTVLGIIPQLHGVVHVAMTSRALLCADISPDSTRGAMVVA